MPAYEKAFTTGTLSPDPAVAKAEKAKHKKSAQRQNVLKLQQSRGPIPRGRKPIAKHTRKRRAGGSEWNRIYGSRVRVAWVKAQRCCVSHFGYCAGPIENAHVTNDGEKGMSRKAGFACIAPVCREHHRAFDQHRFPFHSPAARASMAFYAARTQREWLAIEGKE